jgi:curli production assembly/transport component CsgG
VTRSRNEPTLGRRSAGLILALVASAALLTGCATTNGGMASKLPELPPATASQEALYDLPRPARPVSVAVYGFSDQTGQFKPTENGQTLSRAVSQGGTAMLIKALQDAGQRRWFTVVEREQLKNLLTERQIIQEMRGRYLGETDVNPDALPSLLFAGVILEGGVIGYDTNTLTGGAGAGFLGISASTQYRQDTVTVSLRAVSVRTGEVLATVTASKTIASMSIGGNAFRYVGFKELLEAEAGVTTNEPDQLALQQAVEKAVHSLVLEGAELKLWSFADAQAALPAQLRYRQEREGVLSAAQVAAAERRERQDHPRRAPEIEEAAAARRSAPVRAEQVPNVRPVARATPVPVDPIGDVLVAALARQDRRAAQQGAE